MITQNNKAQFRPYAPPANVNAVLQRIRRMNMPARITREFLLGASISENIIPRVTATLRFLGLINEDDEPTETLRAIGTATDEQYKQLLEQTVRTAYAENFTNIDPATDPQNKIADTFQKYAPSSQHMRQVTLLLGLCREAGMTVMDSPRERQMQPQSRQGRQGKTARQIRQSTVTGETKRGSGTRGSSDGAGSGSGGCVLFGVTEDDIAVLDTNEFNEVWLALGIVARARARAKQSKEVEQVEVEADTQ